MELRRATSSIGGPAPTSLAQVPRLGGRRRAQLLHHRRRGGADPGQDPATERLARAKRPEPERLRNGWGEPESFVGQYHVHFLKTVGANRSSGYAEYAGERFKEGHLTMFMREVYEHRPLVPGGVLVLNGPIHNLVLYLAELSSNGGRVALRDGQGRHLRRPGDRLLRRRQARQSDLRRVDAAGPRQRRSQLRPLLEEPGSADQLLAHGRIGSPLVPLRLKALLIGLAVLAAAVDPLRLRFRRRQHRRPTSPSRRRSRTGRCSAATATTRASPPRTKSTPATSTTSAKPGAPTSGPTSS